MLEIDASDDDATDRRSTEQHNPLLKARRNLISDNEWMDWNSTRSTIAIDYEFTGLIQLQRCGKCRRMRRAGQEEGCADDFTNTHPTRISHFIVCPSRARQVEVSQNAMPRSVLQCGRIFDVKIGKKSPLILNHYPIHLRGGGGQWRLPFSRKKQHPI